MAVLADELNETLVALGDAQDRLHSAYHRISALSRGANPLPAPALTEDAIVAALKADPGMAGRVIVDLALTVSARGRDAISVGAYEAVSTTERRVGLRDIAVALAAASYRG